MSFLLVIEESRCLKTPSTAGLFILRTLHALKSAPL